MTIVPKGEGFLPKYTEGELMTQYQKEADPKAKVRLLAAILRKEGLTLQEISDRTKHPLTTVGATLAASHVSGRHFQEIQHQTAGQTTAIDRRRASRTRVNSFSAAKRTGAPF